MKTYSTIFELFSSSSGRLKRLRLLSVVFICTLWLFGVAVLINTLQFSAGMAHSYKTFGGQLTMYWHWVSY